MVKRRVARVFCRVVGHGQLRLRDYDLSTGKTTVARCRRCNAMVDMIESPRVQYPRRRRIA